MAVRKQHTASAEDLAQTFHSECFAIADWWLAHSFDEVNGGFWGEVALDNTPNLTADKSIILNTRVLWFFSEAALTYGRAVDRAAAQRAFDYVTAKFVDPEHGGVVWMLSAQGDVIDSRKHTYAQAFAIYALSAYYRLSGDQQALNLALQIFALLEQHAKDREHGGYFEAYARDWRPLTDVRLSEKEDNSPKTMNTNLHVLEAYTGFYEAVQGNWAEEEVKEALAAILAVFCERVVNLQTGHLRMFMNEAWEDHSHAFSFGHDVEASWLIEKAIAALKNTSHPVQQYREHVTRLAEVALQEGMMTDGRMAEEFDLIAKSFTKTAWWVQAEAMVGFANMWGLGYGDAYKQAALRIWAAVQTLYKERTFGEWLWFANCDVPAEQQAYKVGAWKAPYHNGRAMMMMGKLFK